MSRPRISSPPRLGCIKTLDQRGEDSGWSWEGSSGRTGEKARLKGLDFLAVNRRRGDERMVTAPFSSSAIATRVDIAKRSEGREHDAFWRAYPGA